MGGGLVEAAACPRRSGGGGGWLAGSAAVQGRDKEDVVTRLDLVGFLALELPVGVVDENQDAGAAVSVSGEWFNLDRQLEQRSYAGKTRQDNIRREKKDKTRQDNGQELDAHVAVEHEHVGPRVLHQVLAEVADEEGNSGRVAARVGGGQVDGMAALVVEEHLESPAAEERRGREAIRSARSPQKCSNTTT